MPMPIARDRCIAYAYALHKSPAVKPGAKNRTQLYAVYTQRTDKTDIQFAYYYAHKNTATIL